VLSRDGIAGLVCLGASLVLLGMSRGLPKPALVPIGPGFYPRILFVVTAILSVALVVVDLTRRTTAVPGATVHYRLVALAFAIFTAYVFLLPVLGYRLGTFLFVAVLQVAIEPPSSAARWALVAMVAIGTTAGTYYVFERYLSVLLPRGTLTGF
jgi:putative tricarboxylic transport membrane protein